MYTQMYRGIIHKARMRRLYNNKLTKVRLSVNDDKQSKDNEEKKEKEKNLLKNLLSDIQTLLVLK